MRVSQAIEKTVLSWDDVTVHPHRFGGTEFRRGRRELGHLHGESLLDVPFPVRVKKKLLEEGRVQTHHILPDSGWISFRIRSYEDIEEALALLQRSFEIAVESEKKKTLNSPPTTFTEESR